MNFEGVPIAAEPTFDELDSGVSKDACYLIPVESASEIERAQTKLGRALNADEVLSILIHRSARPVLDESGAQP